MSAFVVSPQIGGKFDYKLAAVAVAFGEIALINSTGYATFGQITTGMVCKGVFEDSCDNSAGDPGDKSVAVQTGWDVEGGKILIPLKNASGGNAVAQEHVGRSVFVFDKNTVSGTSNGNTRVRAGKCEGFTREGLVLVHFDGDQDADELAGVEDQLNDLELQVADCPAMQAVNATLASGTVTISSGIVVAANSEVVPVIIGHIAGSTNFGSLGELKTSRVNGAAGVGTVVIEAISNTGGLDSDASGAIRVLVFTPTT